MFGRSKIGDRAEEHSSGLADSDGDVQGGERDSGMSEETERLGGFIGEDKESDAEYNETLGESDKAGVERGTQGGLKASDG